MNQPSKPDTQLIYHIKKNRPEVEWVSRGKHMLRMMVERGKYPPTRVAAWCCEEYKHFGGKGMMNSVGIRAEESPRRKAAWSVVTRNTDKTIICPILFWTEKDIWQFSSENNVTQCQLYKEFKRLGCVGCPKGAGRLIEFKRWPRYEKMWHDAICDVWEKWHDVPRKSDGKPRMIAQMQSGEELWKWWMEEAEKGDNSGCQMTLW